MSSVDIDGNIMVVGVSDVAGAVRVYQRQNNGTTWVSNWAFLSGDSGMGRFGRVVAVKGDRIAVASQGSVSLFEMKYSSFYPYSYWSQRSGNPALNEGEGCGSGGDFGYGYSIALVGENGLLIGCPSDNDSVGSVRYLTRNSSTESYIERQIITPSDESIKYFGGGDTQLAQG